MSDYTEHVTQAFEGLNEEQKVILIKRALEQVSEKMEADDYAMIGLLLREANDRISDGGATTG